MESYACPVVIIGGVFIVNTPMHAFAYQMMLVGECPLIVGYNNGY